MNFEKSIFGPKWGSRIANAGLALAKLAGYDAARPTITREQQTYYLTNPNSAMAQTERVAMQWNAEYLAKNVPFAIGYLVVRANYCSPNGWEPNTGDRNLDKDIKAYCEEQWKGMGIGCSMQTAFARASNHELPTRGDSGLLWYRDVDRLRLIEFSADQIGELYTFRNPGPGPAGLTYFAGMYFEGINRVGMKIYERGFNQVYTNPKTFPESDIIYFQDNVFRGIRGVTRFFACIESLSKAGKLLQFGLDSAQKQAKTGVVIRNGMGAPMSLDYETRQTDDGQFVYLERSYDGAVTQYQYNGDEYQLIQTTSPGPELIEGCRYADEQSSISLGMPYSFLVNAADVNGAPYRGELGKAGKEIGRITKLLEPEFEKIAYVTIMDGVERGVFRGSALSKNLTRGTVLFPNLPTADSFRDTKDDIISVRAGLDSPQRVLGRYRENASEILEEKKQWAIDVAKATQDANRELKDSVSPIDGKPYEPTIDAADIAQNSDNPQQSATAEEMSLGVKDDSQSDNPPPARLSAFIRDVQIGELPDDVQIEIQKALGQGDHSGNLVSKYGMAVPELLKMADHDNLATARHNIRYSTCQGCAEETHSNATKHVLTMNGRIVDGHHFLAKAEKGKVTKSLQVIDLSPVRFQQARMAST